MTNQEIIGNIMVVDDQPANLKLLEDMLRGQGHRVRSFPRGRLAISAALQNPPDLILLDINMPEMNGYQVCEQLKANPDLRPIPVIFLSAISETADKVKAFQTGGCDYVTKPFQVEEVQARVGTHLELRRALQAERDLLDKTLNGAARAFTELVHLTSPVLAFRSEAIRSIVMHLVRKLSIPNAWQYELAANLSLLGCIALPEEAFEKAYAGHALTALEERTFRSHPESGARLVGSIPRLETVAQMIAGQQDEHIDRAARGPAELGARMLSLAMELDRRMSGGMRLALALHQLRSIPGRFDPAMLDALADYTGKRASTEVIAVRAQDLLPSMMLEEDVVSADGRMVVVRKGATLSLVLIERIGNFMKLRGVREPILVRLPEPLVGNGSSAA